MPSMQAAAPSSSGGGRGPASGKAYQEAFSSVRKRIAERAKAAAVAVDWQQHADSYLALSAPDRAARLFDDPHGDRLELALALAERAATALATSRGEASELADLSLAVVDRVLQQGLVTAEPGALAVALDAAATAWAVHAEAALLDDDRERADLALLTARVLADNGSGDPLVAGAVAMAQALSQWVTGDLDGTTAHLDAAVALYRQVGESRREALALLRKVMLLEGAGRSEDARQALGRVVELSQSGVLSQDARELLDQLLRELGEGEVP